MATGALPFPGDTTAAVFDSILNKHATPLLRRNPGVPPELERIANKALEKDLDLRYQSAAEVRSDLKRLRRETQSGRSAAAVAAPPQMFPRKLRAAYIAGALLVVAVLAVIIFFAAHEPLRPPRVLSATRITSETCPRINSRPTVLAFTSLKP